MATDEELAAFERLARTAYLDIGAARAEAEAELAPFRTSLETVETSRAVMVRTREPTALLYATQALMWLVPNNWSAFSVHERNGLRSFVLELIYERARELEPYNETFLIALLVRLCKLGWLDESGMNSLVDDVSTFFNTSFAHCVLGMRIYEQLIQEINQQWTGHSPIEHRKYVTAFRDSALSDIYASSLTLLRRLVSGAYGNEDPAAQEALAVNALRVVAECFSFDFIGTLTDDQRAKNSSLQIPDGWRESIEDPDTLQLLFTLYSHAAVYSSKALEVITLFVAVRRSLFSSEDVRLKYLNQHMQFVINVLEHSVALGDEECYHHFCQYISRLKSQFHVTYLVKAPAYEQWIFAVANFSVVSFESIGTSSGSIYHILHFWNAMCMSTTNGGVLTSKLEPLVAGLVEAFVASRLNLVVAVADHQVMDDPLSSPPLLEETLAAFPALGRFHYEAAGRYVLSAFDPLIDQYMGAVQAAHDSGGAPQVLFQLGVLESQLAWLVYLAGGLVSGRTASRKNPDEDMLDGHLAVRVFQLLSTSDQVLSERGQDHASVHLERALLYFMKKFRKAHIGDQALSLSRAYAALGSELNLPDSAAVLRVMIEKICVNLSAWSSNEDLLSMTLSLFMDLVTAPYTSLPLLSKVAAIDYLLHSHGSGELAFLADAGNAGPRKQFYHILGIVIFRDDNIAKFDAFMQCFGEAFASIASALEADDASVLASPQFQHALQALFLDLTGVLTAAKKDNHYRIFFDWIYHDFAPLILALVERYYDNPSVVNPMLVFWADLVNNPSRRIKFPPASPNGILLFKATSKILVAYAAQLLQNGFPAAVEEFAAVRLAAASQAQGPSSDRTAADGDANAEGPSHALAAQLEATFSGIELCLAMLRLSFSGDYCCFGVFDLYDDKALVDAIDCALALVVAIPFELLLLYPTLCSGYYAFLEVLAKTHTRELLRQSEETLGRILLSLKSGLQSFQRRIFTQSCGALEFLTTFQYEMASAGKHPELAEMLQKHLDSQAAAIYPEILEVLASIYLLIDNSRLPQWAVAKPFLNFIVLYSNEFERIKADIVAREPPHRRERIAEAYETLLDDVDSTLDVKNRDRFGRRLAAFCRMIKEV
ncbi:importin-beta domain-containing protein [Thecamonas trahens ATCC 50062]|uniref:Importin-beta domain-containing protein n=1 Tax=Thecamonas trahens ATCC 50062 TaxID=461836 RepID=A0A0L0DJ18_THETB|nr:importin-beta domain-containing protein [Thecamonas trahens ATCC 50062]KNC52190.1 importin-beta domain-containing protein [Thecamonas trahens ATCC 50062]|eukprot:XP_013762193.1 importin-beta domain-containing protein [Thecamonas trahens ATCC 50062]